MYPSIEWLQERHKQEILEDRIEIGIAGLEFKY